MKFTLAIAASLLAFVSAAPLEARAGPSGTLESPSGGTTIQDGQPLHIVYKPVNSQGQVTTGIDIKLVVQSTKGPTELSFPLAYSLSASSTTGTIDAYFRNITGKDANGKTVRPCYSTNVYITEHQTGPVFTGSFQSAGPVVYFACQ